MRGLFGVCLLIICHVFFFCFSFCVFCCGRHPLASSSMRTPSQGVTCRSRGHISEHRRDPSKPFFLGFNFSGICARLTRPAPLPLSSSGDLLNSLSNSYTCLHSVSMRRRIMLLYLGIHRARCLAPVNVESLLVSVNRTRLKARCPQTPALPGA